MPVTYGEAKTILSQYMGAAGRCPTADGIDLFVRQVLQYMLFSGTYGNLRKFCFHAVKGCFTAPPELDVPLKIKIEGNVGSVWDKWFEWHQERDLDNCFPVANKLVELPNYVSTAYELTHEGGSRIGVVGTCCESEDAHVIIQGQDPTGRDIYTMHQGKEIHGEYLKIEKGILRYTQVTFGKITQVLKSKTQGYVQLYAYNPSLQSRCFLSDYAPVETRPSYRRFELTGCSCGPMAKVAVLAKIKLRDYYEDNDFIPFDNLYAIQLAGQAVNAEFNNNVQVAQAKDATLQTVIGRQSDYKRVQNGQPIEVFFPLSPGMIRNIVS